MVLVVSRLTDASYLARPLSELEEFCAGSGRATAGMFPTMAPASCLLQCWPCSLASSCGTAATRSEPLLSSDQMTVTGKGTAEWHVAFQMVHAQAWLHHVQPSCG